MRKHLAATETTVPGWDDKPTQRLTSYMLTINLQGLLILKLGEQRRIAKPLSETRLAFLRALGLSPSIFTQSPQVG